MRGADTGLADDSGVGMVGDLGLAAPRGRSGASARMVCWSGRRTVTDTVGSVWLELMRRR